jgi:hypothetical protein
VSAETCASAIVDRAYRNELVTQLFPFKVRDSLSKTIRNGGRNAIMHLFYVDETNEGEVPSRQTYFFRAEGIRERFYEINGYRIVNHTAPDYATCLVRQVTNSAASLSVTMNGPRSGCKGEGRDYHNLYDGIFTRFYGNV